MVIVVGVSMRCIGVRSRSFFFCGVLVVCYLVVMLGMVVIGIVVGIMDIEIFNLSGVIVVCL